MTTVTEQPEPEVEAKPSSGQHEPRHRADEDTRTDPDFDYRPKHREPPESWWKWFSREHRR